MNAPGIPSWGGSLGETSEEPASGPSGEPGGAAAGEPSGDPLIRVAGLADATALAALSAACFGESAWSAARWQLLLAPASAPLARDLVYVARRRARSGGAGQARPMAMGEGGEPLGFIAARALGDELEIHALAVSPAARRRGWATELLRACCARARELGARRALLEVRAGNAEARAFYLRHGFAPYGRRPDYYQAPSDDAVLMRKALD